MIILVTLNDSSIQLMKDWFEYVYIFLYIVHIFSNWIWYDWFIHNNMMDHIWVLWAFQIILLIQFILQWTLTGLLYNPCWSSIVHLFMKHVVFKQHLLEAFWSEFWYIHNFISRKVLQDKFDKISAIIIYWNSFWILQ